MMLSWAAIPILSAHRRRSATFSLKLIWLDWSHTEALSDPGVALLVTEALNEAIARLTSGQQMRQTLERDGYYQRCDVEPPGPRPFTLEDVAQTSIDHAFGDGYSPDPSIGEQQARIRFALALDPACADAYLIEGGVEEVAGHLARARIAYNIGQVFILFQKPFRRTPGKIRVAAKPGKRICSIFGNT